MAILLRCLLKLLLQDLSLLAQTGKDDPFWATALADELPIEDILAVEHDIVPFDGADAFQQGEVDSIGERVALTQDPGDFARLPS
jgi:hypothetical protein